MEISDALRELSGFLDGCKTTEMVDSVELVECSDTAGTGGLVATVVLTLSTDPSDGEREAVSFRTTSIDTDGTLRFALESAETVVPTSNHGVAVEPTNATIDATGTVTVTLSASVPTGDDSTGEGEPNADDRMATGVATTDVTENTDAANEAGATDERSEAMDGTSETGALETHEEGNVSCDRDVPPFRDPELLANVYDSHETFAEMAAVLDMDVTVETVRRYMVDAGVHQPTTYRTADEGHDREADGPAADTRDDGQSPVVLADGIGLPEDVTVEHLIEAVEGANTVHEVQRTVGLDRQEAFELLRNLDLLDLVVGRLATEAERETSREQIHERLRRASATE